MDKIVDLEKQLEKTKGELNHVQGQVQGMKDKVAEAQAASEKAVREHHELNERPISEFDAKDRRLKDSLRAQMDKLIQEQIRYLQNSFGDASVLMDQKYRDLSQQFGELQSMFEGRPSRPEDTQLIKKLQEEILQREGDLKKAAEDMKFYKLELINRESTFNNMFGNNPSVGLMNPMQAATKVGKMPANLQQIIPRKKAL